LLDVGALGALGVDGQLDVEALHRVGLDPGDVQGVGRRGVQAGLAAAAAVVVLADEHRVGQQDLVVAGPLGRPERALPAAPALHARLREPG
jgi:hypothetical protein